MHLNYLVIFLLINFVLCIDESEHSDVQKRYNVNHPPSVEDYNPIPVSVVYEDDVIDVKPHKPKYYDINRDRVEKQKVSTTEEIPLLAPKKIQEIEQIHKNKTGIEKEDVLIRTTAQTLGELHIPVAVIYDSVPDITQNSQVAKHEETNVRRRKNKRVSLRKPVQNKTTAENENPPNLNPAKPQTENKDTKKSKTQEIISIKPQLSTTESAKPQIHNESSVKSEIQSRKPVNPELSRAESVESQIHKEDSIRAATQGTKLVTPQLSRIETVNPRIIASTRQSPSIIETTTKGIKTKRVRDPVVPIVDMENYVYAHTGDFHYSYEGGDGTKAHSEGQLRSIDEAAGEAVSGGFSYTDKDGNDFSLSYTADEHGYRPIGAHLPTPPPIPPAIARALAYLATATTPEPVTKPSVKHA